MPPDDPTLRAFASDNCAGVCPEAWEAIEQANRGYAAPYGEDRWTAEAADLLRELFEFDCEIFFTFTGTAANSLALASLCRSYHSVVAHQSAHVETDECGGPEFFTHGTKLLLVGGQAGRVDLEEVEAVVRRRIDIHYPKPRALSITQSTEIGSVYRPEDLQEIRDTTRRLDLRLHMDGARFANAVASLGAPPAEITWKAGVDVLCFGGAKNGVAIGECVVFFNHDAAAEFAYRCKQAGQLASKMRYLSAPWVGILRSGAWLRHAEHANRMARSLATSLAEVPDVEILHPVEANAVFVRFPPPVAQRLRSMGWQFYDFIGTGGSRLMCSWSTTPGEVDRLTAAVAEAAEEEVRS